MAVAGSTDRELRQVQSGLERAALGGLWERTLRWAADGGARALALRQSGTTKRTSPERVERGRDAQPTRGGGLQALLGVGVSSSETRSGLASSAQAPGVLSSSSPEPLSPCHTSGMSFCRGGCLGSLRI